jgi:uncharacterized protein (DUF58 family)
MTTPVVDSRPRGPVYRFRTFLLFGGAGILIALAVAERNPVPLFAALVFLLAPVAAGLGSPRPPVEARLTWTAQEGTSDVDIEGRLELPASVSPSAVRLNVSAPPPLFERKPIDQTAENDTLHFRVFWKTGLPCMVEAPVPSGAWSDPLNLVEVPLRVTGDPLPLERFPAEVLQLGRARLRRTTVVPGEVRSRAIGEAGEFFSVRPALPTDPWRRINWTATARAGRRMANEYNLERTGDIVLLIDARPTPLGPERDATLLALECVAALGIASGFLREKARVGLGVFDEFLRVVPLGSGRIQRLRIARMLQETVIGRTYGPSERFAISVRRYFPAGVTVMLLSSLAYEGSEDVLTHLRRRGFAPFVLSPSPLPLTTDPARRSHPVDPLVLRLMLAVRRIRISEVWREAPVIDWQDYWSLAPLVQFLRAPLRNRRSA